MVRPTAHIRAIGTAIPGQDIHGAFIDWASSQLRDSHARTVFQRMAARSGIEHRWSILPPARNGGSPVEPGGFYHGERLPSTGQRMALYAQKAPDLAIEAIKALGKQTDIAGLTHLVVVSCTGFVAPGIDQIIVERLGLSGSIERTLVGFMGCYGAVAGLRVAHHIARSEPAARILVVAVELSSLHLGPREDLEALLAELQFGDGAAAALVTAEPQGLALDRFFCATLPATDALIRWTVGDEGFEMTLSGEVPQRIARSLRQSEIRQVMLAGREAQDLAWAVHAGGRSILDAIESALDLDPGKLRHSREILARFGNMSSATLMFVLAEMMAHPPDVDGIAIAFGPGLVAEGFAFRCIAGGVLW